MMCAGRPIESRQRGFCQQPVGWDSLAVHLSNETFRGEDEATSGHPNGHHWRIPIRCMKHGTWPGNWQSYTIVSAQYPVWQNQTLGEVPLAADPTERILYMGRYLVFSPEPSRSSRTSCNAARLFLGMSKLSERGHPHLSPLFTVLATSVCLCMPLLFPAFLPVGPFYPPSERLIVKKRGALKCKPHEKTKGLGKSDSFNNNKHTSTNLLREINEQEKRTPQHPHLSLLQMDGGKDGRITIPRPPGGVSAVDQAEDIWAGREPSARLHPQSLSASISAQPNPCFNLLQSTRQAATNTGLWGAFTSAAGDKEYVKAQFLIRQGDTTQFRLGTHPRNRAISSSQSSSRQALAECSTEDFLLTC
ncbi:hypothetical protein PO909_023939 [Leuciscus waleckii]